MVTMTYIKNRSDSYPTFIKNISYSTFIKNISGMYGYRKKVRKWIYENLLIFVVAF